jgi:hypothetical protein
MRDSDIRESVRNGLIDRVHRTRVAVASDLDRPARRSAVRLSDSVSLVSYDERFGSHVDIEFDRFAKRQMRNQREAEQIILFILRHILLMNWCSGSKGRLVSGPEHQPGQCAREVRKS